MNLCQVDYICAYVFIENTSSVKKQLALHQWLPNFFGDAQLIIPKILIRPVTHTLYSKSELLFK